MVLSLVLLVGRNDFVDLRLGIAKEWLVREVSYMIGCVH